MLSRGADPDAQDTNGNTVLHLLVILQKLEAFDMAYEVGAKLSTRNVLNLTPLTLAAKLARIELFFHILNLEREIYWQIGIRFEKIIIQSNEIKSRPQSFFDKFLNTEL